MISKYFDMISRCRYGMLFFFLRNKHASSFIREMLGANEPDGSNWGETIGPNRTRGAGELQAIKVMGPNGHGPK
jgi:hypothetical protein